MNGGSEMKKLDMKAFRRFRFRLNREIKNLRRRGYVHVQDCGYSVYDSDGHHYSINMPHTFQIYVEGYRRVDTHFGSIGIEDADRLIEEFRKALESGHRGIEFNVSRSPLFIPRWALPNIIEQLEQANREYYNLRDLVFGKGWETEEDPLGLERLPIR